MSIRRAFRGIREVPHNRAQRTRMIWRGTALWLLVAMTASLVLLGGGVVSAQEATPQQYGPLTPEEAELFAQAEQNVDAPEAPVYGEQTGYSDPFSGVLAPEAVAAAEPDNWAVGQLCLGSQQCLVGDFTGDGRDDVAVLYRDTLPEPGRGDIRVAVSNGQRFLAATHWLDSLCIGGQICKVGDVNNDGADDIIAFNRGGGAAGTGYVYAAISQRSFFSPPALWHNYFCIGDEICDVGNVDGVNGDDLILFKRSTRPQPEKGDVMIARSNGVSMFGASEKWHDYFCIDNEECRVGDTTGDNRADIILFVKTGTGAGRVSVAASSGSNFGTSREWNSFFCVGSEQCEIGDFDGNQQQDALTFLRAGYDAGTQGDVWVALSGGGSFNNGRKWHDSFCLPGEDCSVGDFNGDGRDDIVRFLKNPSDPNLAGRALVALASGSATGFIPTPPPAGKWHEEFCTGSQTCLTGDFDGNGRDDVLYLIRNTQAGTGEGDVFVALSNGSAFGPPQKWHEYFCLGSDICKVGDFDGDGDDDVISFSRVQNGAVFVIRSARNGFQPTELWNSFFCVGQEWCEVGDFNGDNRDDIALFTRSTYGANDRAGDVEVAISNGSSFVPLGKWHSFFCINQEWCLAGDVNGDGKDDLVGFSKGTSGNVFVELSDGTKFGDGAAPADVWNPFFCAGNEICDTGDFNGDGRDDIVAFLRSDYPANPATYGDVWVGLSTGSLAAGGFYPEKWNEYFCILGEICETGDFNGDKVKDIAAFNRGSFGDVYVALAKVYDPYYFVNVAPPPVEFDKRRYLPIIRR